MYDLYKPNTTLSKFEYLKETLSGGIDFMAVSAVQGDDDDVVVIFYNHWSLFELIPMMACVYPVSHS